MKGGRKITKVPDLNFGKVTISKKSDIEEIDPEAIILSDYTGTLSGWSLQVKRSSFKTTDNKTLEGVSLKLASNLSDSIADNVAVTDTVNLISEDSNAIIASASLGNGTGETTINYSSAKLELPASISQGKVAAGTYSSTLTWTLTDAPQNN